MFVLQQAAALASSTNIGNERRPSWPPISTKSVAAAERGRSTTPLPVTPDRPPAPAPAPPPPAPPPAAAEAARAPTRDTNPDMTDDQLLARLGGDLKVPKLVIDRAKITALALDHRAGFVLSLVDGRIPIEDILDVSGMPRRDALRILCELVDRGAIKL
jgi:hypothetical protein